MIDDPRPKASGAINVKGLLVFEFTGERSNKHWTEHQQTLKLQMLEVADQYAKLVRHIINTGSSVFSELDGLAIHANKLIKEFNYE